MKYFLTLMILFLCVPASPISAHFGARFEPADGTIYHGCGWDGYDSQAYYNAMFPAEHHPLILQVVADMPGTRGFDVARTIQSLTRSIVHPDSQFIEYGLHFRDRDTMLDSVFALTTAMDHYMDTLAAAFLAVDRPFFLRIGFEFNGFWNPYHPYIFPFAFRKLVNGLRSRGVNNFASVWCYEPDAPADFADSTAQGWKWYPGDDVVDWFGLDPFDMEHFNPALPDSSRGEITQKGKTEAFLRFAEARRKPVYLSELSARNVNIVADSLDPNHDEGQTDWDYWFAPFFQFVNNHPIIKGWNYINLDWTRYDTYLTWGDARLEINSYIRDHWVDSLLTSRMINAGYDITTPASAHETASLTPEMMSISVYPNPFNPSTRIRFGLPRATEVTMEIFDVLGRKTYSFASDILQPGVHSIYWNCSGCPSGMYLIRMQAADRVLVRKMLLMK